MSLLLAVVALLESDATPSRLGQLFVYTSEPKIVIFSVRGGFAGSLGLWLTRACSEADAREGQSIPFLTVARVPLALDMGSSGNPEVGGRLCASSLPRLRTSQANAVSSQASWLLEQCSARSQCAERETVTENGPDDRSRKGSRNGHPEDRRGSSRKQ